MNAALERFCFPAEEKLLDSEVLGHDVSKDSVKDRCELVIWRSRSVVVRVLNCAYSAWK